MFEVVWLQTALDDLAAVWTRADPASRKAINSAVVVVDQELKINPRTLGESRHEGERIFFINPLGITFEIDSRRPLIRVAHVWEIRRRK